MITGIWLFAGSLFFEVYGVATVAMACILLSASIALWNALE
jgi:hypothetical protein